MAGERWGRRVAERKFMKLQSEMRRNGSGVGERRTRSGEKLEEAETMERKDQVRRDYISAEEIFDKQVNKQENFLITII